MSGAIRLKEKKKERKKKKREKEKPAIKLYSTWWSCFPEGVRVNNSAIATHVLEMNKEVSIGGWEEPGSHG